jgi:ABC-type transport system involved in multi-copper enzyme maturation permease subunit
VSAVLEPPPAPPLPPAPSGSLLRAEAHRFRARRFIQVLVALALLGWLATTVIALTQFGNPSQAEIDRAEGEIAQIVEDNERYRQECLANPPTDLPPDVPVEEACGPPMTADDFDLGMFLENPPFSFAQNTPVGALAFGAATAVLAFVLGATWIGAEWSTRSLVSLLFWETRRGRVMLAKLTVLVLAATLLAVVAQAAWLATASILDATAGDGRGLPDGFWGDLLGTQARAVLLVVLTAVGGFGLANLVRNTGAALGIGFVYFAIVETAIGGFRPAWQPWLLTNNAAALLSPGGHTVYVYAESVDGDGNLLQDVQEIAISNLQGGLVLAAVAAVAVLLGVILFARRDVQ